MSKPASPLTFLPLVLGLLALITYQFLPFVNQPILGATSIPTLTESRGNNEFGLSTNGIALLPIGAAAALLLGLWSLTNTQLTKAASVFSALAGVLMLEYFVLFFLDYRAEGASFIGAMAFGFWLLLVLATLLILQGFIPKPSVAREFQLRSLLANQESAIVMALVFLIVTIGLSSPRFLATRNILDILQGNAYIAVAAIGMAMVIITGNIDISVGSLIGLLAVIAGRMVVAGSPIWLSWLMPLIIGALIGALIGFIVAYLKVPSIVVTLGFLSILKGGLIIWTNGERVTNMPAEFYLAQMKVFGISTPILFMIILTILAAIWMRYSPMGRSFYALGGNAEAARLSGFSENLILMQVFILNGVFAGISAVLYATQLRVIQATPPPGLELAIITAVVVGGVSILGGKGTIIGATLAAILLNTIRSGMVFINVSPFWILAVQGILILVTVLIDLIRRQRQLI